MAISIALSHATCSRWKHLDIGRGSSYALPSNLLVRPIVTFMLVSGWKRVDTIINHLYY